MSELLYSLVTEMKGDYPDVPLAPGVQFADQEDKPFLVTLPLLKVGGQSRNGFTWTQADVQRVQEQIVTKRVEGGVGHVPPDQRANRYDLPRLRWVGATLHGDTLWGKAYVPKYAQDVREFFLDAFRTNAKVGTSVYGLRGKQGLADMTLESIDLGHPDRLGFEGAGAVPKITSEMEHEDNPMTDNELVAELRQDRDSLRQQVTDLTQQATETARVVAELTATKDAYAALVSELELGDDPLKDAKLIKETLAKLQRQNLVSEIDGLIAEAFEAEAVRPYIREYLIDDAGQPLVSELADAQSKIDALKAKPHFQALAKALVVEMRGGAAVIAGKTNGQQPEFKDTPEARANARNWAGI